MVTGLVTKNVSVLVPVWRARLLPRWQNKSHVKFASPKLAMLIIFQKFLMKMIPQLQKLVNYMDFMKLQLFLMMFLGMPLDQALFATTPPREHSTLASATTLQALADDKHLVGALGSACNLTCAGPQWLDGYTLELRHMSPSWIMDLVESHDEHESFRFGNGGLVTSSRHWRLPALVSGKLILVWISIVPVGTFGCLLGRVFWMLLVVFWILLQRHCSALFFHQKLLLKG
jgi:hypothetical protein